MNAVVVMILLAIIMPTHAKYLVAYHTTVHDSVDRLRGSVVNRLVDRISSKLLQAQPPHHLDNTTVAKTSPVQSHSAAYTKPLFILPSSLFLMSGSPISGPHVRFPVPRPAYPSSAFSRPFFLRLSYAQGDAATDARASLSDDRNVAEAATYARGLWRRWLLSRAAALGAGVVTAGTTPGAAQATSAEDMEWSRWRTLPLPPFSKRRTVRSEIGPGVWSFDQILGAVFVYTPIRMTVIAMEQGGLFVYAPVAPTTECLSLLQPLIEKHGPVKYIILPAVQPEHKLLAGPFAQEFPSAEFYTTDRQYSFPINLPGEVLGFPSWTKPLPPSSKGLGLWGGEFEHDVLTMKPSDTSTYQDAAFFHKPTKTLMLCDSLIALNGDVPQIVQSEPEYIRGLLFWARNDGQDVALDSPEARRRAWQRMALFPNFFKPGCLEVQGLPPFGTKPAMPEFGSAGTIPFAWRNSERSFEALSNNGKPTVPLLVQIILARDPTSTLQWIDAVTQWDFVRVVPVHFDGPVACSPAEFSKTFDFLRSGLGSMQFCEKDVAFLRDSTEALAKLGPSFSLFDTELGRIQGRSCGLV